MYILSSIALGSAWKSWISAWISIYLNGEVHLVSIRFFSLVVLLHVTIDLCMLEITKLACFFRLLVWPHEVELWFYLSYTTEAYR